MFRPVPVLTALSLVALSGLAHGLVTARWHKAAALEAALERVPAVPLRIGGWHGSELPADPEMVAQAQAEAYWMRSYQQGTDRPAFTVILMCGRAGPLSVHTPDVCYRGAGYEMAGSEAVLDAPIQAGGAPAQLWTAVFRKEQPADTRRLRLFWTRSADGTWQAPRAPRLAFAGRPFLYKLYVVRELAGQTAAEADATVPFLRELLPALSQALFGKAATEE